MRWNETLESSRCWRVAERERGIRFGGWCAQKWLIRKDERREKDFQRDILRDANERDTREQERRICSCLGAERESFGAKKWFHMKKFFSIDRFLWIFDKFFGFRFGLNFFQLCSSRKRPHWKRDNYSLHTSTLWPKERNRREKPRNRYDQTESFSRVKMRRALTFCCPSFLRA